MTNPLVSIVIATYNLGRYLPETLDSALAQTHPLTEIIVIDDGSTDDTGAAIHPYLSRIRFRRIEHAGLAAARNTGLRMATGEYIALLDADDLWLPEKLAVQLDVARRHPQSGMIVCDGGEFGSPTSRRYLLSGAAADALRQSPTGEITSQFHRGFIRHVNIRCPAQTLIPRRVMEQVGPFADFYAQDYNYYLRLSARFPVTFHRNSLVRWRDREQSMSGARSLRELTWSRQKLMVLRDYISSEDPIFRQDLASQIIWNRAEIAFHYGELFRRSRATRALLMLLRKQPWPPKALPFLLAHAAPGLARSVHKAWRETLLPWLNRGDHALR